MAGRGPRAKLAESLPISYVQIEGMAMMKIVKHCHDENVVNMDIAQGALLGLVVNDCLEITNCFPFPKPNEEDEEEYQLTMMRRLRMVNIDHFHVGWYQSAETGSFLSLPLMESQYHYQINIEESVVVIYDSQKSNRGFLSIKAYRLSPKGLQLYKEQNNSADGVQSLNISFEDLFVEVPVIIRNSHLINILLCELTELLPDAGKSQFLDLGTTSVLESQLRCLMDRVDDQNQEANKLIKYHHTVQKQAQEKLRAQQKRVLENAARQAKGEAPLPDDDINKLFKPIPPPSRINPMIVSGQISGHCQQISQFCSESIAKLFISEALQQKKAKP